MDVIGQIALALGASWCAGINLYATVFVLGALSRYSGFELPAEMMVLENPWVMGTALGLYTVEFFADKIPALDSAWDSIHTFLRIPAGAALAATSLGPVPMEVQMIAVLIGGTIAGSSHTAKATTRLAAHSTGTSPVVSPSASVVEDVVVVGTLGLVALNPALALVLIFVLMSATGVILWMFWKVARKLFTSVSAFLRGGGSPPAGTAPV